MPRQVSMEIKARAVGDITKAFELHRARKHARLCRLPGVRSATARGIVFHVTELD
ncbi:MAG: hypothetical protein V9G29_14885 [Burkholderiaceae bacterium]